MTTFLSKSELTFGFLDNRYQSLFVFYNLIMPFSLLTVYLMIIDPNSLTSISLFFSLPFSFSLFFPSSSFPAFSTLPSDRSYSPSYFPFFLLVLMIVVIIMQREDISHTT